MPWQCLNCSSLLAVQVGRLLKVSCKADLQKAEAAAKDDGYLLMDASDWKVSSSTIEVHTGCACCIRCA
jgi:hypothetical protein